MTEQNQNFSIPFNIIPSLLLLPFYCIGKHLKNIKNQGLLMIYQRLSELPIITVFSLIMLSFALLIVEEYNGLVNIFRNQYGNNIFAYYFASLIGSCVVLVIARFLDRYCSIQLAKFVLVYFGRHSLQFMCVHQVVYLVVLEKMPVNHLRAAVVYFIQLVLAVLFGTVLIRIEKIIKDGRKF